MRNIGVEGWRGLTIGRVLQTLVGAGRAAWQVCGPGGAQQVLLRSQKLSARGGALHGGLLVGEGLSQVQALLLLDVFSMSVVLDTACGVKTKLIEFNTTVSTK